MSAVNAQRLHEDALEIVAKAGKMIASAFEKTKNVEEKDNPRDLVTDTDKAVEKFVKDEIARLYPDHQFIGEESTAAGAKCVLTDTPTWIVDPVDGTMNFVHSFPFTCISVGVWVDKKPLVGVIYNPILDLKYSAIAGSGASLNGKPIHVSKKKDLSESLVMTELWCRPDPNKMAILTSNALKVINKSHGPRCMGSAALNMCMVAQGGAEAYYEIGIHAWDTAAAILVVREAGGVVVDVNGEPFDLMNRRVLCAASEELVAQLVEVLEVYEEERD